jgi:O-antigen ligase
VILTGFILYVIISISWANNPEFGIQKLIHFLVGNGALVLSFGVILGMEVISRESAVGSWNSAVYSGQSAVGSRQLAVSSRPLAICVVVVGIISSIVAILIDPFDPTIPYSFEITRWSHVVYGRFAGLAVIVTFLLLINESKLRVKAIYSAIFLILFTSLVFSGFRGGIIGVGLSIIIWMIYDFLIDKLNRIDAIKNFVLVLMLAIAGYAIAVNISDNKAAERFESVKEFIVEGKTEDGTINTRIEAFRIAWKMFEDSPLTGSGLGNFNGSHYGSEIGVMLKYPHNILIEFLSELGLIGFGFLTVFLWAVLRRLIRTRSEWLVIFAYGIMLAMFSKDLGSNGMVWVFVSIRLNEKK